jgi:methylated-DNA-[protein]-cysteine S-methyltransferase
MPAALSPPGNPTASAATTVTAAATADSLAAAGPDAPSAFGHALFDTAIGRCGIAWGPLAVWGVQLPEADDAATQARLLQGLRECAAERSPSALAQNAIDALQASLGGQAQDLAVQRSLLEVSLHWARVSALQKQIYDLARAIPPGRTRSYGELAQELGNAGLSRSVGQALGLNPFAPIVPCHRVLAAGQRMGGFSGGGGAQTKLRLLEIEGALAPESLALFAPR